ncbi:MAG: AAA family ATPase [Candidatus Woesearchaeota archaeon]
MGLFDNMLGNGDTLIKNEKALDYEFVPPIVPYRQGQQEQIAACIKPLFASRQGRNCMVYGAPGIGKTVAVKHLLRELEEQTDEILPIYINCWQHNTTYKIILELCDQVGYKFTQNKKTVELMKKAAEIINKSKAVLVFDEIDKAEDHDFLYWVIEQLFNKSIILITNYKTWLAEIDERIKSRLTPELLEFKAYNAKEVAGIIHERIEYAFVTNVWDSVGEKKVAEKTFEIGDIRTGLFLLRESALQAEEKSSKKVTVEHIDKALAKLDDFTIKSKESLEEDTKMILDTVNNNSGKRIGDLYKSYKESGGAGSYKTFQRRIAKLDEDKFISTERTHAGGTSTIVNKKITDFGDQK